MALTQCPHCDDQHVCHSGDSHEKTKAIENLLMYAGYRAGRLAQILPFAPGNRDIMLPAGQVMDLVMGVKTLEQVLAEVDRDIPV